MSIFGSLSLKWIYFPFLEIINQTDGKKKKYNGQIFLQHDLISYSGSWTYTNLYWKNWIWPAISAVYFIRGACVHTECCSFISEEPERKSLLISLSREFCYWQQETWHCLQPRENWLLIKTKSTATSDFWKFV